MFKELIFELITKIAKTRDIVLTTLPSALLYLLDAWQDIIPWLTQDEAGGIFALVGYSVSKLYDMVMGDRKTRRNELSRARNFVDLLERINSSETIPNKTRSGINELIGKIELQIEMKQRGIIKQKEFTMNLDELIKTFTEKYEKKLKLPKRR